MRITLDDSEINKSTIRKPQGLKSNRKKENTQKIHLNRMKPPKPIKRERGKVSSNGVKKATKIIFTVVAVLFTVFLSYGGYLVYKTYKAGKQIGLNLRPSDVISREIPTLKKDSTGTYTNALIVGIDTRETGNLLNTDSIILASYNHKTNDIIMMSIPRDLHVEIDPGTEWYRRINSVYSTYEQKGEGEGLERLREVVTEVTGHEIQYHAMIDYKGFVELIDTLGGVEVNVEKSFTDYAYPDGFGYKTVSFQEGPQVMDGETALEYSRSRHSMQNNEGSDFARARRQQNVLTAVTDKVISSSLLDPQSLMNLFNVVQDNVKISEFTLNDIEAGITELKKFQEDGEAYSFVLDPSAVAGQLLTSQNVVNTGAYAIGPIDGLGNYEDIQEYINHIWQDPKLYEENPVIRIYNTGLGYNETREKYLELTENLPYLKIYYAGTLYGDKEGTVTYINATEGFTNSLKSINRYINPASTEQPEYITTRLNGEDITILFGKEIVSNGDSPDTE
jgi:LCP family protein required for cell wall assembly